MFYSSCPGDIRKCRSPAPDRRRRSPRSSWATRPVNALDVAGWHELARVCARLRDDPAGARRHPRRRGPRVQRRRRHQGDAAHRRARGAARRQPRVLRRVRRRLRVRGARHRRGARLLPRRRHRPGRQRRHHRGLARRDVRAARGRPRRPRRGHAPGAPRARSTRCGRWSTPRPRRPPTSSTASARSSRWSSRGELRAAARRVAAKIAAKSPTVIRAAKQCLNGIDPVDVKRSYRFEQGFTFELNLVGRGRRSARRLRREARREVLAVRR